MNTLRNLGEILRLPALADRAAFIDLRRPEQPLELSARELDRQTLAVARGLVRRRVAVGDRVAILAENRLEFMTTYLGAMRMGAVAVPINFRLAPATISHIFRDSEIRLAFVDERRAAVVPPEVACVSFDAAQGAAFAEFLDPGPLETFLPGPADLAEILYTSGSTGLPKAVGVPHANVACLLAGTRQWFRFGAGDVWTWFHSAAFDFSVWEIWGALLHGARLVVVPYWVSRAPGAFA